MKQLDLFYDYLRMPRETIIVDLEDYKALLRAIHSPPQPKEALIRLMRSGGT